VENKPEVIRVGLWRK